MWLIHLGNNYGIDVNPDTQTPIKTYMMQQVIT